MRFSERMKINLKTQIQKNDIDIDLRNGLWNIYSQNIVKNGFDIAPIQLALYGNPIKSDWVVPYFTNLWDKIFKIPIDTCPLNDYQKLYNLLRNIFLTYNWHVVYDIIDFTSSFFKNDELDSLFNEILERELSAYRIVSNQIAPLINDIDINSINNAIKISDKFFGVKQHLETSLSHITDRKKPDYRNSIKESISAVESLCKIITNDKKAELGKTLKKLEEKQIIHGALKNAFSSLYGFTSDSDGIRHALFDEPNLYFEDALYFLLTCSAFISFLIQKCDRLKIKI